MDHYARSHRTPVNRALHFVGIPRFLISSLGLLAQVAPAGRGGAAVRPNAAWPVLLGAGVWYPRLDGTMGLLTVAAFAGGYAVGRRLSAGLLARLFGAGVVAHAVGHYGFEGRPPALFSKPVSVLEAPAGLLAIWAGLYR